MWDIIRVRVQLYKSNLYHFLFSPQWHIWCRSFASSVKLWKYQANVVQEVCLTLNLFEKKINKWINCITKQKKKAGEDIFNKGKVILYLSSWVHYITNIRPLVEFVFIQFIYCFNEDIIFAVIQCYADFWSFFLS